MSPTKSAKLEDQGTSLPLAAARNSQAEANSHVLAATAALYVTKGKGDRVEKSSKYPLDADGKLSSASMPLYFGQL